MKVMMSLSKFNNNLQHTRMWMFQIFGKQIELPLFLGGVKIKRDLFIVKI